MKIEVLTPAARGRGRPRADEPGSRVSTWITTRQHDDLIRQARTRGVSVSAVLRGLVAKADPKSGT